MSSDPERGPGEAQEAREEALPESREESRYRRDRSARVDHILRRISRSGMGSLAVQELRFLDRVSAELRYELGWSDERPGYDED